MGYWPTRCNISGRARWSITGWTPGAAAYWPTGCIDILGTTLFPCGWAAAALTRRSCWAGVAAAEGIGWGWTGTGWAAALIGRCGWWFRPAPAPSWGSKGLILLAEEQDLDGSRYECNEEVVEKGEGVWKSESVGVGEEFGWCWWTSPCRQQLSISLSANPRASLFATMRMSAFEAKVGHDSPLLAAIERNQGKRNRKGNKNSTPLHSTSLASSRVPITRHSAARLIRTPFIGERPLNDLS